jgi:hypothetical protein
MAPYLVKLADILGRAKGVTEDEIQLWRKHLLPVKDSPMEAQKAAVAAWFHEMQLLGLSEASPEDVEAFLGLYNAPAQAEPFVRGGRLRRRSTGALISNEMHTSTPISFDELLASFEWVSASLPCENEAYVSRITGNIYLSSSSNDVEEELPVDIEDETVYVTVPNKRDLDLGRGVALRFVEENLPESYNVVHEIFRGGGAYPRFKALLERQNQLESWYEFEKTAVEQALREWIAENGLQLKP